MPYNEVVSFAYRQLQKHQSAGTNKPFKVLDLGCGGGNNLRFLHELGFEIWGVDASIKAIELTRSIMPDLLQDRLICCEFIELPFENDYFDFIVDRASIGCNLSNTLDGIFSECARVLKSGGELLSVNLCAEDHPHLKFGTYLGNGDYNNFQKGVFFHASQIHAFEPTELIKLLSEFQDIEIEKVASSRLDQKYKFKSDISSYNVKAIKK